MSGPITVSILGKDYQIACPTEEQNALRDSAELLNNKMLEIRGSGKVVGVDRIAVMAALNLAHDLLAFQTVQVSEDNEQDGLNARIEYINERVSSFLSEE